MCASRGAAALRDHNLTRANRELMAAGSFFERTQYCTLMQFYQQTDFFFRPNAFLRRAAGLLTDAVVHRDAFALERSLRTGAILHWKKFWRPDAFVRRNAFLAQTQVCARTHLCAHTQSCAQTQMCARRNAAFRNDCATRRNFAPGRDFAPGQSIAPRRSFARTQYAPARISRLGAV